MANSIQWLNYHNGLFLEEEEFKLEQNYHLYMRQRLNYAMFNPGVLYGMDLIYNVAAGTLRISAGMAVDEYIDAQYGPLGRELALMQDSSPIDLIAYNNGDTVWITIGYGVIQQDPKAPTNIPSRNTLQVQIDTHATDPGTGTDKILLGAVIIGTDVDHTVSRQNASLRLGGAAPVTVSTLIGINPGAGLRGSTLTGVTVSGTNLAGATGIVFDPASGLTVTNFTGVDNEHIRFDLVIVSAAALTARNFRVTVGGNVLKSEDFGLAFTVTAAAPPQITGINPDHGGEGTSVIITGTQLSTVTAVRFGGIAATSFTVNSNTQITATVPAGAVTGKVTVTASDGQTGESVQIFNITPSPEFLTNIPGTPGTEFDPNGGNSGKSIKLYGRNFSVDTPNLPKVELVNSSGVAIHDFIANTVTQEVSGGVSYELLTVTAGNNSNSAPVAGNIKVATSGGNITSNARFTLYP